VKVIVVDTGSHDVLELGKGAAGGETVLRGEITRGEGSELLATGEVASGIDDLWLSHEGVAAGHVGGAGVAVVATADGVDEVAAKAYPIAFFPIFAAEIQRYGRDFESYIDAMLLGGRPIVVLSACLRLVLEGAQEGEEACDSQNFACEMLHI
jgi:hypothetical protein